MSPLHMKSLETAKDKWSESCHCVVVSVTGESGCIFSSNWFYFLKYLTLWAIFFAFCDQWRWKESSGKNNRLSLDEKCHNYKQNISDLPWGILA
jgi:hypothetical protein